MNNEITVLTRKISQMPFVPEEKDTGKVLRGDFDSVNGTEKKRLDRTGTKHAVVGISGGLDSAHLALLVTAKAFDALGLPRNGIEAVTMPCETTDRTYQNACKMSRKLGASLREIPIAASVEQHFRDIGHDIGRSQCHL